MADTNETFGAKLRRLAGEATALGASRSLAMNPPLMPPAPWAAKSPVQSGEVRAANGNWYVCGKTGTTAASGTGPAAIATSALIVDNNISWAFLCPAPKMTASPLAPVVTRQVAATPAGLPNYYNCVAMPGAFRVTGAYPTTFSTNFWQLLSFNSAAGKPTSVSSQISFVTDAAKFAIGVTNGSGPVRVVIDGRYVDAGGLTFLTGGTPTWLILDFSSSGRAIRNVSLEFTFVHTFAGVAVSAGDSVWAPAAPNSVRCAIISDSLFSGSASGPFLPGGDAASYMGKILGWDDCWNCSAAGTGYVAAGGGALYSYGQRVPELLTRKPDIWLFMGSTNDVGSAPPVQAAALAALKAIRAGGSTAPIVMFGLWSIENYGLGAIEAAIGAAVAQSADSLRQIFFIPIYGDPVLPWITGRWNNAKDSQSSNASLYIGSDGIHPTETGTMFEGVRLANAIAAKVLPNIL